jgi:hypothetical protein
MDTAHTAVAAIVHCARGVIAIMVPYCAAMQPGRYAEATLFTAEKTADCFGIHLYNARGCKQDSHVRTSCRSSAAAVHLSGPKRL